MCIPSQRSKNQIRLNRFVLKKQFKNLKSLENYASDVELQDIISITTHYTKQYYIGIQRFYKNIRKSPAFRIVFSTTQPSHLITIIAVAMIMFLIYPSHHHEVPSKLLNFIYLGSFGTYLGSQIWMTFVSGLSLYFSLPRHHFGNVQKVLFPKYFSFNSILCLVMLAVYTRNHKCEFGKSQVAIQTTALATSFMINLLIRLYLAPRLLHLMTIKNRIEQSAGIGMEIGEYDLGELKQCPHYIRIYKSFRKVHMTIAMGNVITMAANIFHLYYLSSKLCLL